MVEVTDFTALLAINEVEYHRWNSFASLGANAVVSYSFLSAGDVAALPSGPYDVDGFHAFTQTQKAAFRDVVALYESLTGLTFVEVGSGTGMIDVYRASGSGYGGWAHYPYVTDDWNYRGDLVIDNSGSYAPGSYAWLTMLHELGHALGLQHPHDGSMTLAAGEDTSANTVMTYNIQRPYSQTLGPFDIAALEHLYGETPDRTGWTVTWDEDSETMIAALGAADDTLSGIDRANNISAGAGDDTIHGREEDDTLDGGAGNDTLDGRGGHDTLMGGDGNDSLSGGEGDDRLEGGAGDDRINGDTGDDLVFGGEGDDHLGGQAGNDLLDGEAGNDRLEGFEGNDTLFGRSGEDQLLGHSGADVLRGGARADFVSGGDDNDRLLGNRGSDRIVGGGGHDTLLGGHGQDSLSGGSGQDRLYGQVGDDRIQGNAGLDALFGGVGADRLWGQADADILRGGSGRDRLFGGSGADVLGGGGGRDFLKGGAGDDRLIAGRGGAKMSGEEGDDTFVFQAGALDGSRSDITDFDTVADCIDLTASGLTESDYTLQERPEGLLLTLQGGTEIMLLGLTEAGFDDACLLFA